MGKMRDVADGLDQLSYIVILCFSLSELFSYSPEVWVCLKMIHKASDLICVQITTTSSSHLPITVLPSDKEKFLFNFPEHHSFIH